MTTLTSSSGGEPRQATALELARARMSRAAPLNTAILEARLGKLTTSVDELRGGVGSATAAIGAAALSFRQALAPLAGLGGQMGQLGTGINNLTTAVGELRETVRELLDSPLTVRDRVSYRGSSRIAGGVAMQLPLALLQDRVAGFGTGNSSRSSSSSGAGGTGSGRGQGARPWPAAPVHPPAKVGDYVLFDWISDANDILTGGGAAPWRIPGVEQIDQAGKVIKASDRLITGAVNRHFAGLSREQKEWGDRLHQQVQGAENLSGRQIQALYEQLRGQWNETESNRHVLDSQHGDAVRNAQNGGLRTGQVSDWEWQLQTLDFQSQSLAVALHRLRDLQRAKSPALAEMTVTGGGSSETQAEYETRLYGAPRTSMTGNLSATATQTLTPVRPADQVEFERLWEQGDAFLRELRGLAPGNTHGFSVTRQMMGVEAALDRFAEGRPLGDPYGSRARTMAGRLRAAAVPVNTRIALPDFQVPGIVVPPPVPRTPPPPPPPSFWTQVADAVRGGMSAAGSFLGNLPGVGGGFRAAGGFLKGQFSGQAARDTLGPLTQKFTGLFASLGPLGLVATLLGSVFQGLSPVVEALKEPLRMVGEIFGAALAPVLRAIFPIFRFVAIAATYVGEFLFRLAAVVLRVNAAILEGIGGFIKAIGKFINKILPGNPAKGLVKLGEGFQKAGKGMRSVADGFEQGANQLKKGRQELQEMEFDETADAAADMNAEMRNVPDGFKVALARFEAAAPQVPPAPQTPEPADPGGGYGGGGGYPGGGGDYPGGGGDGGVGAGGPQIAYDRSPVHIESVQIVSNDPERIWRDLQRVMQREGNRRAGTPLGLAFT